MGGEIVCWCGSNSKESFSENYYRCLKCNTLISACRMPIDYYKGSDEPDSLYGCEYWTKHVKEDYGYPDIFERSRSDLTERCLFWVKAIIKYRMPPGKVLELGCAHGGLVFYLKVLGFDAMGAEMSQWLCEYARTTFDVPMLCGAIEDIDIAPKSLDIIILMDVLEHMPDPVSGLIKIEEKLKDDGIVVIQTPCWRDKDKTYEQLIDEDSNFLPQFKENEHLYIFNQDSLQTILNNTGFTHIYVEPQIFPYDTFVFASKKPVIVNSQETVETKLQESPRGRILLGLLDLYNMHKKCDSERVLSALQAQKLGYDLDKITETLSENVDQNKVQSVLNSYSWKITKPLRWLCDILRSKWI